MRKLFVCVCAVATLQFASAVSDADKKALVGEHNDLRRKTAKGQTKDKDGKDQPPAADMTKMSWDDKVAATAQKWADSCPKPGPGAHEKQTTYGENIAWGGPPEKFDLIKLTKLWYAEIDVDPGKMVGDVSAFTFDMSNNGIGHYTQMMTSKAFKLGCGDKVCDGMLVLVCRYMLGGNVEGEPIYEKGEACSKCRDGQKCDDGLCDGSPLNCSKDSPGCKSWVDDPEWGCGDGYVMGECPTACGLC